jgi:hypothetical protein
MWQRITNILNRDGHATHIIPVDDLKEHSESADCWCQPKVDEEINLIVHNSADNREAFEEKQRMPS